MAVRDLFGTTPPAAHQNQIDVLAQEFEDLRHVESPRLQRMADYRAELEATRKTDLDHSVGSTDYGRRIGNKNEFQRHRFKLPLGRSLTVKHANRIAGRMPDAIVDRREESHEERHRSSTMERIWWAISRASEGETQFADGSWDGSEVGATAFEIQMDLAEQIPNFRAIDPAGCLVVRGLSDPHDFERVYRWWQVPLRTLQAQYRGREFMPGVEIVVTDLQADPQGMVTVVQTSDRHTWTRFALGQAGKGVSRKKNVALYQAQHDYGFVPYTVIPNLGPYRNIWGWSDYEFVRELVRYVAVYFGREADILKMVASGAMKAKGLQVTAAQVRQILAEGGILPVGRDGDLTPVEVPQVPAFAEAHADRALEYFKMLGFAPDAAWGAGSAGSGSDRGLQLQPMFELTSMKQKNWSAGLSRMGAMGFKMVERMTSTRRYTGSVPGLNSGGKSFSMLIGPGADPLNAQIPDPSGIPTDLQLSMTPKELFDGDYSIRFVWQNRVDVDDPAYVNTELQKFTAGVQSLHTTLERLGVQAPEEEVALIEKEANEFPWIRDGVLKMIEMQLNSSQQGQGGGQPFDQAAALAGAGEMMQTKDGAALDADATASGLPGGIGQLFGGA